MSLDQPDADVAYRTAARHDYRRQEAVDTTTETMPAPARHGANGTFTLEDLERDADELRRKWGLDDDRPLPNGSAYQHARAAWLATDDIVEYDDKEYRVLSRDFEHPHDDEDGRFAVTLVSSPWRAGREIGGEYRAFYKYDLTLRPVDDDGAIRWGSTPDRSFSVKIRPQREDLIQKDGSSFDIPYSEGSFLTVQATWLEDITEAIALATKFLGGALGYQLKVDDICQDSARFTKAEVHQRIERVKEQHVVQTIRQSADLLAAHEADLDTRGKYEDGKWMECWLQTDAWEKLGFPALDAQLSIKVYYPDHPEKLEYPMDQPKVEVALEGKERVYDEEQNQRVRRAIPMNRWNEVMAVLEEVLLTHLSWADVREDHLVADDYSDGPDAPPIAFQKPEGRREWLQRHYESLVPPLYRQATSHRTDLVYDILAALRDAPDDAAGMTYDQLVEQTGAAYRTVRKHVRRLCEAGPARGPGILERERGAVTLVSWSSRFLEELGQDVLDEINPGDQPEDRRDRAEERRERREQRQADQEDVDRAESVAAGEDESTGGDAGDGSSTWRYFGDVDLRPDQLARALDQEYLDHDEVRVRVDNSPLFATGPPG
ncbi:MULTISPECIES: winged helix-turn-helix domain-containing protein [Salinibaculum]|uniref:winged helix-turn-helix domain-containing protein n=1 Tax=Salinibaculum TaxID=2732368 RepID=UPI0030D00175